MANCFTTEMRMYFEGERRGDAKSAFLLSMCLEKEGFNAVVVQNHCHKAAKLNYGSAQTKLAIWGLTGKLIDLTKSVIDDVYYCEPKEAVQWLSKATEANDKYGTYLYAKCYQHGLFVDKDYYKAETMISKVVPQLDYSEINALNSLIEYCLSYDKKNGSYALPIPNPSLDYYNKDNKDKLAS